MKAPKPRNTFARICNTTRRGGAHRDRKHHQKKYGCRGKPDSDD